MNPREKILALAVGGMLVLVGGWLAVHRVTAWFTTRQQTVERLERDLKEKKRAIHRGQEAAKRLASYDDRALPGDRELARSLYQTWLLESIDHAKFTEVNVTAAPGRTEREVFYLHTFNVAAHGDLDQCTRWLHGFYSANHLHRLRRLSLRPIKKTKNLEIQVTVEALSLPGSANLKQLAASASTRLTGNSIDDYLSDIVGRNMFSVANNPPKFTSSSSQRGFKGRQLKFSVQAKDSDELDHVRYALAEKPLKDARFDARSGEFSWMPPATGEFSITVTATDDGLPSRTATQTIKLTITDPPPAEPIVVKPKKLEFDDAKYTFVTAIVQAAEEPVVWLNIRTTGETLKLKPGAKLTIGSIDGRVAEITDKSVVIATADNRFLVLLGDNLLQGQPVGESDLDP